MGDHHGSRGECASMFDRVGPYLQLVPGRSGSFHIWKLGPEHRAVHGTENDIRVQIQYWEVAIDVALEAEVPAVVRCNGVCYMWSLKINAYVRRKDIPCGTRGDAVSGGRAGRVLSKDGLGADADLVVFMSDSHTRWQRHRAYRVGRHAP